MKLFSAAQIRACDAYTIKEQKINSLDLMERASASCVGWIKENLPAKALFIVLCGTGNNGGDGLAIARMLHMSGYGVKAFLLQLSEQKSEDCATNYDRLKKVAPELINDIPSGTYITDIPPNIIIIDAIFGTGINRPITGWAASFIKHVNRIPNPKIAIDMPSGLPADNIPQTEDTVIKATHTLSFQFLKRSMMHPESEQYTGNIHVLDIGLSRSFIRNKHTLYVSSNEEQIKGLLKPRRKFAHKGNQGKGLIIGGEYGKIGAMVLSATAAIRSGAGLVTALIPRCGYHIMQTAVPEVMCTTNGDHNLEQITTPDSDIAIGIGPGIGKEEKTAAALLHFLEDYMKPIVIDADALNIMAAHPEILSKLPKDAILTPHPKEFERLFGKSTNSMAQVDHARIQAMRYNINIVLKGHHTVIIDRDGECIYNTTGNSGMATAGSGDVLTGLITGLLAQGYPPKDAAIIGVFVHGMAGDFAADEQSQHAMIASDIIRHFGSAFKRLVS